VREYGRTEGLPRVGRSTVYGQVAASLKLVPLSHLMVRNLGGGITFNEYLRLPPERRATTRSQLPTLQSGLPGTGLGLWIAWRILRARDAQDQATAA
jgi:hypothetical protein